MVMKVEVDPQGALAKALGEASAKVSDLTLPLNLIAQQWFKSNVAIFTLVGAGKYVDLTDLYKKRKTKAKGSPYPILKWSGALESSITDPTNAFSIHNIINRNSLLLGTRITSKTGAPYAYFLHNGTSKMAARPVVLFGNEQVAPSSLTARIDGWRKLILAEVARQTGAT